MMSFCVLVKGPCRGKQCDFWARVKIRKRPVDELVREIYDSIIKCENGSALNIEIALGQFWTQIGIRDMENLCSEDPDLCAKIREVENQVRV